MPRPIDPVKRVYYADDLTVWASGVNIPDLEVSINNYLEEITAYLKNNSLLISASKFSVNYSPQILTRPRPILVYSSRSHACRWLNALIIQQAHPLCSRESIKQEQHPYSISRYILYTTEENTTDDLQIGRKIDHQLHCTCLESKPTRHQLHTHSNIHRTRLWRSPLDVTRYPL